MVTKNPDRGTTVYEIEVIGSSKVQSKIFSPCVDPKHHRQSAF